MDTTLTSETVQAMLGLFLLFSLGVIILLIRNWIKHGEAYEAETKKVLADISDDEAVQGVLRQGYIFCFFWRIDDVISMGKALGFYLTDQDAIKITHLIKQRWNPETGLNNTVIREAIMEYCTPDGSGTGRLNFDNAIS